jgi:peroxiredoxin
MDEATPDCAAPINAKPSVAAVAAIVVLAAFTIFITWRAKRLETALLRRAESPPLIQQAAPDFSLTSLDGHTVSLADYRGKKKLVLTFWASWCGPCRLEIPALQSFYERHRKDSSGFEILAISIDEERAPAEAFATEMKSPFPMLLDLTGKTATAYHIESIPALYVVDESGKIIYGHVGYDMTLVTQLENELGLKSDNKDAGAPFGQPSH